MKIGCNIFYPFMKCNAKHSSFVVQIILTLLLCFAPTIAFAQITIQIPDTTSEQVALNPGFYYYVTDPGGIDGNYPGDCDGELFIYSNARTPLIIQGSIEVESAHDHLFIIEGEKRIREYSYNNQNINMVIPTGVARLRFISDHSINYAGFILQVTACDTESIQIHNCNIENITSSSAHISWDDQTFADEWKVYYGYSTTTILDSIVTTSPELTLTGLLPHTDVYIRVLSNIAPYDISNPCIARTYHFKTLADEPFSPCINYADFNSEYISFRWGRFYDLFLYDENIPNQALFYHRQIKQHQIVTSGALPDGYNVAVQIGDDSVGSCFSSITYEYHVDTLNTKLLMLKHSAWLENPDHSYAEQPGFFLRVFDHYYNTINPRCYSADFIADNEMWNWNFSNPFFNNGWTTIGIDLTPYHNQTLYIYLMSRDCKQGAHMGKARYVIYCNDRSVITSSNCGEDADNTFTAPEGFKYRWFNLDNPSVTIDTTRSIHVTTPGYYKCELTFLGANYNTECHFDLINIAGARYPTALFDKQYLDSSICDSVLVRFINHSVISTDSSHNNLTTIPCESYYWLIDHTRVSHETNPMFYLSPGWHTVTLTAYLAGENCENTLTRLVYIKNPCDDTVYLNLCENHTITMYGTTIDAAGTYILDSADRHRVAIVTVLPSTHSYFSDTIVQNQLPFTFLRTTFYDSVTDTAFLTRNHYRCDSLLHYTLHVYWNDTTRLYKTICENQLPYTYKDSVLYNADSVFTLYNTYQGADSLVIFTLNVEPVDTTVTTAFICNGSPFTWINGVTYLNPVENQLFNLIDSTGCLHVHLLNLDVSNQYLRASYSLTPHTPTYTDNIIHLTDNSSAPSRLWKVNDMTDTSRTFIFPYPFPDDSVTGSLTVYDLNGCADSSYFVIIPDRATLWVPNAFTPDEQSNNLFLVKSTDITSGTVYIYDRNGLFISSFDINEGSWDGTAKGRPLPQGAYVWKITYTTLSQPDIIKHAIGTVLIIR